MRIRVRRINPTQIHISLDAHYASLLISPEMAEELITALQQASHKDANRIWIIVEDMVAP